MYMIFTRKGIVAAISLLVLAVMICSRFSAVGSVMNDGETNAQRVQFIKNLNIDIKEECTETKQITVPVKFSDVYLRYNNLQKQAGYDLTDYAGCGVTRYTYTFSGNPDKRVNLLVYKGKIIGGDISDIAFSGKMLPLAKAFKPETALKG